jgi:phage baseplate assembly protein V
MHHHDDREFFPILKYGLVSDIQPGQVKVYFDEDAIPSKWLPVVVHRAQSDTESWQLEINEQVVCLLDGNCEEGVVVGAIHSDVDPPDNGEAAGKFRKVFSDGTLIEYDKNASKYSQTIKTSSFLQDGQFTINVGDDSLKDALTLIIQAVQQIVVMYGNNPDYTKLSEALTKVNNIFK